MFKPAGFTAEGTYTPDLLIAGCHPVEQKGFTIKAEKKYVRGTLIYLKSGETQYEAYDGGTLTASPSLLAVLVDDVDTTGAAASHVGYIAGDFNTNAITVATGGSLATVRDRLAQQSLYLHDSISA